MNIQPALGRLILPGEENQPGKAPVLVLGYSYWQKRFRGDPGVIGKQVRLNGKPAIIVGVVPKQFLGTMSLVEMDGYLPLSSGGFLEQASGDLMQRSRFADHAGDGPVEARCQLRPGAELHRT